MALARRDVVAAALQLADADGLDALTLRSLAARLGVQAPTLYWHVRNKAELLDAIADEIMDEVLRDLQAPEATAAWPEWLLNAAGRFRSVLLQHADGARIVAGARTSLRRADFAERAVSAAVGDGVALRDARLIVLAVERFTIGYVLDEQTPAPEDAGALPSREELAQRLPNLTRAIVEYFETGRTADDLFDDEIRLILRM